MIWGRERADHYGTVILFDSHNNWMTVVSLPAHRQKQKQKNPHKNPDYGKLICSRLDGLPIIDAGMIPGPPIPNTVLSLPY